MIDQVSYRLQELTDLGPNKARRVASQSIASVISSSQLHNDLSDQQDYLTVGYDGGKSIKPQNVTVNWNRLDSVASAALGVSGATEWHVVTALLLFLIQVFRLPKVSLDGREAAVVIVLNKYRSKSSGVLEAKIIGEVNDVLQRRGYGTVSLEELRRIIRRLEQMKTVERIEDRVFLIERVVAKITEGI